MYTASTPFPLQLQLTRVRQDSGQNSDTVPYGTTRLHARRCRTLRNSRRRERDRVIHTRTLPPRPVAALGPLVHLYPSARVRPPARPPQAPRSPRQVDDHLQGC